MFRHIYFYRLRCLLRNRQMVFWSLLFPMALAVFFGLALSGVQSGTSFHSIPIAVVDNDEYRAETGFQTALQSVSDTGESSAEPLFQVSLLSREEAGQNLEAGDIVGYILFDGGAHVVVKASDISQTILKQFVDTYLQTASAYETILRQNPEAAQTLLSSATRDFLKDTSPTDEPMDEMLGYYYALIAMAVMYGGYWGKKEVEDIQADLSRVGARMNLIPVHKLRAFLYSCCAAVTVEFLCLLGLMAFLTYALGIDFGSQTGYILVLCFLGSILGVAYGALLASVVKGPPRLRGTVMLALNLLLPALAGLMSAEIKYTVTHALPALSYINPANFVSDALYSLYYYSSHARFYTNMGCILGMSVLFFLIVYLVLRRRKYASL